MENGCRRELLSQKEPPNINGRQPENHSKFIEKVPMTAIAESLSVSTSTVIRKLKEFKFMTDLSFLPTHMSWDEYSFKKGLMNFIAQNFDSRKIVAILDGRTQVTIRNHFLRYSRLVRNRVKVITMDMFSPTTILPENFAFEFLDSGWKQSPVTISLP